VRVRRGGKAAAGSWEAISTKLLRGKKWNQDNGTVVRMRAKRTKNASMKEGESRGLRKGLIESVIIPKAENQ